MFINLHSMTGLFVGFRSDFNKGRAAAKTLWQMVADEIPSRTDTNNYPFEGSFPRLREWKGSRFVKNIRTYFYSLQNVEFEATVEVPRKHIINDQYGVFRPKMQMMGASAAMHPDELVFGAAAAGATGLCYDDQPFFNGSHPLIVDGVASTTSNYDSTAVTNLWMLLDCSKPMKPFIYQQREPYTFVAKTAPNDDNVFWQGNFVYGCNGYGAGGYGMWQLAYGSLNTLNATNVDAYATAMKGLKDDEGHPLYVTPTHLVVGPSNEAAARDLVKKEFLTGGGSNPHFKAYEIVVSPFLT